MFLFTLVKRKKKEKRKITYSSFIDCEEAYYRVNGETLCRVSEIYRKAGKLLIGILSFAEQVVLVSLSWKVDSRSTVMYFFNPVYWLY